MANLQTRYLNLNLKNPIIIGSSGLTKTADKIADCEAAGAVVLKSLFEEVLAQQDYGLSESASMHTEAIDYIRSELEMQYEPEHYCDLIVDAKNRVDIPVIASINCMSAKWWPSFARKIETAGADALELNVFKTATNVEEKSADMEQMYSDILSRVKNEIDIPVALKIGSYFTALPRFAYKLAEQGVDGLVLFNRFTEADIDIEKLEIKTTFSFSTSNEMYRTLRWIAILSGQVDCDLSATTGVKSAKDVIKLILAGASSVQIASLFYQKGLSTIPVLITGLKKWMDQHRFESIDDFKGNLNFTNTVSPDSYLRVQFMEKIRGVE